MIYITSEINMLYEEYLKLNSLHLFLFTKKSENLTEFVLLNCTF